jgi:hypothetical protein
MRTTRTAATAYNRAYDSAYIRANKNVCVGMLVTLLLGLGSAVSAYAQAAPSVSDQPGRADNTSDTSNTSDTASGTASGQAGLASSIGDTPSPMVSPSLRPAAESSVLPGRINFVTGAVQLRQAAIAVTQSGGIESPDAGMPPAPPPDVLMQQAEVNAPVPAGTQISTGADGQAEVQFSDGSIARATPQSSFTLTALGSTGEVLRATQGLTYYEIPPDNNAGNGTRLLVGTDTLRAEAGSLLRVDMDSAPYTIAVLRGSAHINNAASDIGFEVTAGQTATVDPRSASNYDLQPELVSNSWDSWNNDRDEQAAELAAGETNARVGNGDDNAAGWDDLDYYGTWYDVPGVGMGWAPDGVDADFDPYGSGAWGLFPGAGYVWISAYPWGWLPYHCGGWNYFNGFGYLWQPGTGCGAGGWYPYTGVHHAPPGYHLPWRPMGVLGPKAGSGRVGTTVIPHSYPGEPTAPVVRVQRGPSFRFRQIGGARPDPRPLPVKDLASSAESNGFAPTLPVFASPRLQQYRAQGFANGQDAGGVATGNVGLSSGNRLERRSSNGGAVLTPGLNSIAPPPNALPAPRNAIVPSPWHAILPPPMRAVPPPTRSAPEPHFSAPAAASPPRSAPAAAAPSGHSH